jgi:hypothetical protein
MIELSGSVRKLFAACGRSDLGNDFARITTTATAVTGKTQFITQLGERGYTVFTTLANLFVSYLAANANVHNKALQKVVELNLSNAAKDKCK